MLSASEDGSGADKQCMDGGNALPCDAWHRMQCLPYCAQCPSSTHGSSRKLAASCYGSLSICRCVAREVLGESMLATVRERGCTIVRSQSVTERHERTHLQPQHCQGGLRRSSLNVCYGIATCRPSENIARPGAGLDDSSCKTHQIVGTHPATAYDGAQSEPYAVHSRHAKRLVRMIRSGLMISQWTVTVRRTSDAPS